MKSKMRNTKYLIAIFVWVNQTILITGMGLFPILPLYAGTFNANASTIGLFMALVYVAISIGTMASGWLGDRIGNRRTYIAAGLAGVAALLLLTQARNLIQANFLVGMVWFTGGIGLSLNTVFVGLLADKEHRGKAFGLISLTPAFGAIVGSLTVGKLVQYGGYGSAFLFLAVVWVSWPLIAFLWVPEISSNSTKKASDKPAAQDIAVSSETNMFPRLLVAALLSAIAISIGRMGLSMDMKAQGFTAMDVSSANIVAGIVTLPLAWSIGSLSDRFGRKRMLVISYGMVIAGVLLLSHSASMAGYMISSAMLVAAYSIGSSLANAYATDILPADKLGQRMPWVNTTKWVAGVIGFASSGYAIQLLGMSNAFMASALLPLVGLGFLTVTLPVHRTRTTAQVQQNTPCPTPQGSAVPVNC